jgi:hypothetical protein
MWAVATCRPITAMIIAWRFIDLISNWTRNAPRGTMTSLRGMHYRPIKTDSEDAASWRGSGRVVEIVWCTIRWYRNELDCVNLIHYDICESGAAGYYAPARLHTSLITCSWFAGCCCILTCCCFFAGWDLPLTFCVGALFTQDKDGGAVRMFRKVRVRLLKHSVWPRGCWLRRRLWLCRRQ